MPKDHYIPAFFIGMFADEDKGRESDIFNLWSIPEVLGKHDGKPVKAERVGRLGDLYPREFDTNVVRKLEDIFPSALRRIKSKVLSVERKEKSRHKVTIKGDDFGWLLVFKNHLTLRHKKMLPGLKMVIREFQKEYPYMTDSDLMKDAFLLSHMKELHEPAKSFFVVYETPQPLNLNDPIFTNIAPRSNRLMEVMPIGPYVSFVTLSDETEGPKINDGDYQIPVIYQNENPRYSALEHTVRSMRVSKPNERTELVIATSAEKELRDAMEPGGEAIYLYIDNHQIVFLDAAGHRKRIKASFAKYSSALDKQRQQQMKNGYWKFLRDY